MTNEKKANMKFHRVLREYERGKLRSHSTKKIVRDKNEALAIAFSEARKFDPKYKLQKHASGTKIKIDNTLQLIFEDAWSHYLIDRQNRLSNIEQGKTEKLISFDEWLRTTNDGLKYNKRMAQLIRIDEDVEPIMNERGAKISNNNKHRGGRIRGALHKNGGVKAIIVDTKQPVEVEGGELIITKNVDKLPDIVCSGNPEAIASQINQLGGGDKISNKNATCHLKQEIMERGKKIKSYDEHQKDLLKQNIQSNYPTSNPEILWNNWTEEQRYRFLTVYDKKMSLEIANDLKQDPFENLSRQIKNLIYNHIIGGRFEHGSKIKSHLNQNSIAKKIEREQQLKNEHKMEHGAKIHPASVIFKINEPKEFAIVEFLFNDDIHVIENKVFKTNDVCIYAGPAQSMEKLAEFMDKYGIHYTEFDDENELKEWLIKQLPARIKNKIQQ